MRGITLERSPNAHLFDCRRFIRPGDTIQYESIKCCDRPEDVDRHSSTIPYEGYVLGVYEKFVIVKLKRITECVNRWDIRRINGKTVGNETGYFAGMVRV